MIATPLVDIQMRSIEWLEKPLWQKSAFELLAAPKGAGKGTYLAGLASRITRNGANAIFLSSEDSAEIDLKPRLVAAGADIARCFCIQQSVCLPDDVESLQDLANDIGGVGLLVIDPVANHIGDSNSNSDAEVRNAIAPLNRLADELGCLLIGVRHPGKDRSRGALASILGSTAWVDTSALRPERGDDGAGPAIAGEIAREAHNRVAEAVTLTLDWLDNEGRPLNQIQTTQFVECVLRCMDGFERATLDELMREFSRIEREEGRLDA